MNKKNEVAKFILMGLVMGSIVLIAATAPNAARVLLAHSGRNDRKRKNSIERAIRRLERRNLIRFVRQSGKEILEITGAGKERLRAFELDNLKLSLPKCWDKLWTVIMFDIPEKKKNARDALRIKLEELGCFAFHKSVFIHPAFCADEIDFVAECFQVSNFITHFRTPTLGRQEYRARRFFKM